MATKTFKDRIAATMQKEDSAVEKRFTNADSIMSRITDTTKKGSAKPQVKSAKKTAVRNSGKQPVPQKAERVIRDNYTIPESDYAVIAQIQQRCMKTEGLYVSKSELIRAGLRSLQQMSDKQVTALVKQLTKMKPGRKTYST
jgi:hypothetical protein